MSGTNDKRRKVRSKRTNYLGFSAVAAVHPRGAGTGHGHKHRQSAQGIDGQADRLTGYREATVTPCGGSSTLARRLRTPVSSFFAPRPLSFPLLCPLLRSLLSLLRVLFSPLRSPVFSRSGSSSRSYPRGCVHTPRVHFRYRLAVAIPPHQYSIGSTTSSCQPPILCRTLSSRAPSDRRRHDSRHDSRTACIIRTCRWSATRDQHSQSVVKNLESESKLEKRAAPRGR